MGSHSLLGAVADRIRLEPSPIGAERIPHPAYEQLPSTYLQISLRRRAKDSSRQADLRASSAANLEQELHFEFLRINSREGERERAVIRCIDVRSGRPRWIM
ncbi:hypothetical protein SAY86_022496 [Trapa natans]|uniref:Uncharacterized protein n=1 Tax=Trapa natans TaxID=22666 RepID=A0AAN7R9C2_TRANT|nr:hypothetical protein SAY86_022496 [Trapa natans]